MPKNTNESYMNILHRRSCRAYKKAPVSDAEVDMLLQAAFSAPSAARDSRRYSVVQNPELLTHINTEAKVAALRLAVPNLSELAVQVEFNCLHGAPGAIIISCNSQSVAPESDCATAAENILLAAHAIGLGGCWIFFPLLAFEGDSGASLRKALDIPEGYKPYGFLVFGHPASDNSGPAGRKEPVTYFR